MAQQHIPTNSMMIMVGTKFDLATDQNMDKGSINRIAKQHGLEYYLVSSKTGEGV